MQQSSRIAAPLGLRRLLRKELKEDKRYYSRGMGPVSRSFSRIMDLEAGGTGDDDNQKAVPWYRPNTCRTPALVFFEAVAILGLLVALARVRARCGTDSPER